MTQTSHGPRCDVCDQYILGLTDGDMLLRFSVTAIEGTLDCHVRCRASVEGCEGDWTKLPEGPLRRAYAEAWEASE